VQHRRAYFELETPDLVVKWKEAFASVGGATASADPRLELQPYR
jgi:hypothetical protein